VSRLLSNSLIVPVQPMSYYAENHTIVDYLIFVVCTYSDNAIDFIPLVISEPLV